MDITGGAALGLPALQGLDRPAAGGVMVLLGLKLVSAARQA